MLFVIRFLLAGSVMVLLSACAPRVDEPALAPRFVEGYGPIDDAGYNLPGIPDEYLVPPNRRAVVFYNGDEAPGTIEVDPYAKFLFYVGDDGTAIRYPIAVGREGKGISGKMTIRRKAEWPGWMPTANMVRNEPEVYGPFRRGIPGGLRNPLGARALYLYRGNRDSYFRIHGTNDLGSIGNSGSAGCIRLFNPDVIDLFDRIELGTKVVIRTYEDSVRLEGEAMANRGVELPPKIIDPELIYGPEAEALDHPPVFEDVSG